MTQKRGDSRNNVHPECNLPTDRQIATSNNKTLDTPNRVKFVKNIVIVNIRSFFEVMDSPLPLQSTIVK